MNETTATNVSAIVRLLLGATRKSQADLARAVHVSAATITRRLDPDQPGSWSLNEIDRAARFFDVPVTTFWQDPSSLYERLGLPGDFRRPFAQGYHQPSLWDDDESVIDLTDATIHPLRRATDHLSGSPVPEFQAAAGL